MKYSSYHSPSALRIRRSKYYSTYPKAQKSSTPFRRTKSLNLKRRTRLPNSVDSETQTDDAVCLNDVQLMFSKEGSHLPANSHVCDNPSQLLSSKFSTLKLHGGCTCGCGCICSVTSRKTINQIRQECVECYMLSQHSYCSHNERSTDRPNRLFKKNHAMSRIRLFFKGNLRRYNSTQVRIKIKLMSINSIYVLIYE